MVTPGGEEAEGGDSEDGWQVRETQPLNHRSRRPPWPQLPVNRAENFPGIITSQLDLTAESILADILIAFRKPKSDLNVPKYRRQAWNKINS